MKRITYSQRNQFVICWQWPASKISICPVFSLNKSFRISWLTWKSFCGILLVCSVDWHSKSCLQIASWVYFSFVLHSSFFLSLFFFPVCLVSHLPGCRSLEIGLTLASFHDLFCKCRWVELLREPRSFRKESFNVNQEIAISRLRMVEKRKEKKTE